jgi:hypothetical protein
VDIENYKVFMKSLIQDENLILYLKNRKDIIKAITMTANIIYRKEVYLKGINRPKIIITKIKHNRDRYKNIILTINLLPLKINLGIVYSKIRNNNSIKIIE